MRLASFGQLRFARAPAATLAANWLLPNPAVTASPQCPHGTTCLTNCYRLWLVSTLVLCCVLLWPSVELDPRRRAFRTCRCFQHRAGSPIFRGYREALVGPMEVLTVSICKQIVCFSHRPKGRLPWDACVARKGYIESAWKVRSQFAFLQRCSKSWIGALEDGSVRV